MNLTSIQIAQSVLFGLGATLGTLAFSIHRMNARGCRVLAKPIPVQSTPYRPVLTRPFSPHSPSNFKKAPQTTFNRAYASSQQILAAMRGKMAAMGVTPPDKD